MLGFSSPVMGLVLLQYYALSPTHHVAVSSRTDSLIGVVLWPNSLSHT